jgi:hypothetical protein
MNDLFVGANLVIHGRMFELTDADAYTLKFMASDPQLFWRSDPQRVVQAVRSELGLGSDQANTEVAETLREELIKADPEGQGSVTMVALEHVLERCVPPTNPICSFFSYGIPMGFRTVPYSSVHL